MTPGVYIVEHKTASGDVSPGSLYWAKLTLDSQVSNYMNGARALGFDPVGVLYDVIRKLPLEPRLATPEEERRYTQPKSRACPLCKRKSAPPAPHRFTKNGAGELAEHDDGELRCEDGRVVTEPARLYAGCREVDETPAEFTQRCVDEVAKDPDKYLVRAVISRTDDDLEAAAYDVLSTALQLKCSTDEFLWPRNTQACGDFGRLCDYHAVCAGTAQIDDDTLFVTTSEHTELAESATGHLPVITTSSAKTYRRCPRLYLYQYVMRRRPLQRPAPLTFGTLMHHGLEHWWRTVDVDASVAAMLGHEEAAELPWSELVKLEVLLRAYDARWRNEAIDVLAVEREFAAPVETLGGVPIGWIAAGKIDAIARVKPTEKTSES